MKPIGKYWQQHLLFPNSAKVPEDLPVGLSIDKSSYGG
jgi:hypothetical protein